MRGRWILAMFSAWICLLPVAVAAAGPPLRFVGKPYRLVELFAVVEDAAHNA